MKTLKIIMVLNDKQMGGVQMRAEYLKNNTDYITVISRSNTGNMDFQVIESFKDRIDFINSFDIVSFETNGSFIIPELFHCKNITVETIHSPCNSNQKTDMKIGVSDTVTLKQSFPCQTIYPGIEVNKHRKLENKEEIKKKYGIPLNMPIIGRIGRLCWEKGIIEFCNIAAAIKNAYYIVVGDGPEKEQMTNAMSQNGMSWNYIPNMLPAEFWSVIDILLYPTIDESYCNVLHEAVFNEIPFVCFKIPVTNELNMQIRVLNNNEAIAAVNNLIKNKDLREGVIRHNKSVIKDLDMKYSIPKLYKLYRLLYENR